jgi:hypothetical protein
MPEVINQVTLLGIITSVTKNRAMIPRSINFEIEVGQEYGPEESVRASVYCSGDLANDLRDKIKVGHRAWILGCVAPKGVDADIIALEAYIFTDRK